MASQVFSGASNPNYTNNTGQNVRVIINYMYATSESRITINWAGVSVAEDGVEAIGKNIACGTAWYGDFLRSGFRFFLFFFGFGTDKNPVTAISAQNVAIRLPRIERSFTSWTRGWFWWWRVPSQELAGFSVSVALPLEIYLAPNESFSAECGAYNISVIKEDGT